MAIMGLVFWSLVSFGETNAKTPQFAPGGRHPAADVGTNCEVSGLDKVFPREFAAAGSAWCQEGSKATYMAAALLRAISGRKAVFVGGAADLADITGFTAVALGGYKLEGGMVHVDAQNKKMMSLRFAGTDTKNNDVKYYDCTYALDKSVSAETVKK